MTEETTYHKPIPRLQKILLPRKFKLLSDAIREYNTYVSLAREVLDCNEEEILDTVCSVDGERVLRITIKPMLVIGVKGFTDIEETKTGYMDKSEPEVVDIMYILDVVFYQP